jgi:tRNA-Thr(GGU) m(6)t(6)A37 methyltransferase TsaA
MEGTLMFSVTVYLFVNCGKFQLLESELQESRDAFNREKGLLKSERESRINMQIQKRGAKKVANERDGYCFKPIGIVESPFPFRRGTPRQPILVTAATGRIRMNVHSDYYNEITLFSHIWVLFIFHDNTNEAGKESAKITPPRLGQRVGCLSTRSPHRPNPIGLSVCQVVGVSSGSIDIACLDMVDGTPVLDIKPYIPYDIIPFSNPLPMLTFSNDNIQELKVPSWIHDSDIILRPVQLTDDALESLSSLCAEGRLSHARTLLAARRLIEQVLAQDIRGIRQGRGAADEDQTFECSLDNMRIEFVVGDEGIFVNHIEEDTMADRKKRNYRNIDQSSPVEGRGE